MDHITLQKVDESNFLACFSLRLEAQQEKFVSPRSVVWPRRMYTTASVRPLRSAALVRWSDI